MKKIIFMVICLNLCLYSKSESYEIFNIQKNFNSIEKENLNRYDNGKPIYMQDCTITVFTSMDKVIEKAYLFREIANSTGKAIVESINCEECNDAYKVIINCYVKNIDSDLMSILCECQQRDKSDLN